MNSRIPRDRIQKLFAVAVLAVMIALLYGPGQMSVAASPQDEEFEEELKTPRAGSRPTNPSGGGSSTAWGRGSKRSG